ncbi:MAG: Grx4 family monothiol glutaredoxin [Planctomycetota bacterium]
MTIAERIQSDLDTNRVMLYMKGAPEFPMCGFSSQVVQVLKQLDIEFGSADVLQDMELRQGIKDFSDWPTLPQLYVDGNFVGGCDIVLELFESGELQRLIQTNND